MAAALAIIVPLAAEEGGGKFLVQPKGGLMIWTLVAFVGTFLILRRFFLPKIQQFLDERRRAIQEAVDAAERTRRDAEDLLQESRERLKEARQQADDIVVRARKAADRQQEEAVEQARRKGDELMAHTRREIEIETRRALERIRKEVADLTVIATEKVTRKVLDEADHRRLVAEAIQEVDFSRLGDEGNGRGE